MLIVGVLVLGFGGCMGACALGPFESIDTLRFGPNLRGYTFSGLVLGFASLAAAGMCFVYSLRKHRDGGSSMMAWLWSHVWFGVLALVLGVLHGGCGCISLSFTSGKVLLVLFIALGGTGIVWRLRYASVPREAGPQVLNYSKEGALRRAEEQLLEIEKITAGKSTALHQIKDQLLVRDISALELASLASPLPPEERGILEEIVRLAQSRRRALARPPLQAMYTEKMQKWRRWHVPLSFAFVLAFFFHVLLGFDTNRKIVPMGLAESGPFAPFRPSAECKTCHETIYKEWQDSMHAHALTSPLTIVQNNLDMKHTLKDTESPDPRRMCINCHGPAIAAVTSGDTLPLKSNRQDEGVECVACHQLKAATKPGGGALAGEYQSGLARGNTYFGQLKNPIGNAYHKSDRSDLWREPDELCGTCHNVTYDMDRDGRISRGSDLILQTTFDEWRAYQQKGGRGTCISCHMPSIGKLSSSADSALIPFQQDYPVSGDRKVHDHSFVGVDYPLDTVRLRDPQKAKRQALLASAASIDVADTPRVIFERLSLRVSIQNQSGHNLPTGFAFARQMWLEVTGTDNAGRTFFSSGLLARPTDDLCDNGTFGESSNPLKVLVQGCAVVDDQLVNFQLKLIDRVSVGTVQGEQVLTQPVGSNETYLQRLTGGGVGRTRPFDGLSLSPLKPQERRSFSYSMRLDSSTTSGTWRVRLLFRNLPPYWVRGMGRAQPARETPRLEPLIENIQTVVMAERSGTFTR